MADHPDVSGFSGTGVHEDEGQHLQEIYPPARAHGGPGRFALDPAARLTEASELARPESAEGLLQAWQPHWDTTRSALVEKSPPNLIRMRFLRCLFPSARFIVIIRHPIAVAMATSKWSGTDMELLFRNWVAAHARLQDDAKHVGGVAILRYEDLMNSPEVVMDQTFAFLGVRAVSAPRQVRPGVNEEYYAQYADARWPWERRRRGRLAERYAPEAARFGYSLTDPLRLAPPHADLGAFTASRP